MLRRLSFLRLRLREVIWEWQASMVRLPTAAQLEAEGVPPKQAAQMAEAVLEIDEAIRKMQVALTDLES